MVSSPLTEVIEAGRAQALKPVADRIAAAEDFLRAEVAAGRTHLPAGRNVLRIQAALRRRAGADRRPGPTPHAVVTTGNFRSSFPSRRCRESTMRKTAKSLLNPTIAYKSDTSVAAP